AGLGCGNDLLLARYTRRKRLQPAIGLRPRMDCRCRLSVPFRGLRSLRRIPCSDRVARSHRCCPRWSRAAVPIVIERRDHWRCGSLLPRKLGALLIVGWWYLRSWSLLSIFVGIGIDG